MRLIDADALFKEEREEYRNNAENISTDYKHIFAEIDDMPTVCDIDAIRREIEDLYIITNPASGPYDGGYYTALIDVRRIIDKYTKGE